MGALVCRSASMRRIRLGSSRINLGLSTWSSFWCRAAGTRWCLLDQIESHGAAPWKCLDHLSIARRRRDDEHLPSPGEPEVSPGYADLCGTIAHGRLGVDFGPNPATVAVCSLGRSRRDGARRHADLPGDRTQLLVVAGIVDLLSETVGWRKV